MSSFKAAEHPFEIAVVHLDGWFPSVIDWATRGEYCHSFAIANGHLIEAEPQGVVLSPLNRYDGMNVLVSRFDFDEDEEEKFSDFLHQQLGKKYDYVGDVIVGLDDVTPHFLDPVWHLIEHAEDHDSSWFCSALSDRAVTAAGRTLIPGRKITKSVTPNDIAREFVRRGWDK